MPAWVPLLDRRLLCGGASSRFFEGTAAACLCALIGVGLLLSAAGCTPGHSAPADEVRAAPAERPNIIYIYADDAGYGDFSVYGQERFQTPHIDRMAAEGMRFTQHYAGSTVCAPSRSALMTGRHTGHTYIRGNEEVQPIGQAPLPDSIYTLTEMLQDAGYRTGLFGKWGLGYPGSEGDPMNQGVDTFFGYNCQRNAHSYYPYFLWRDHEIVDLPGNAGSWRVSYSHDLIQEEALQFIEESKNEPFFMFVPYTIPHAELLVPRDSTLERFRNTFDEPNPFEGADYGEPGYRSGRYASQPTPRAAFAAMMTRMDRGVGQILGKLQAMGLDENTIVMFSSDNGPGAEGGMDPAFFNSNGPFRGFKRDLYEGGIRVPFVARWPGHIEAGTVTGHVSAQWDLLPTLADLAGAEPPENIDGLSLVPTLTGEPQVQKQHEYLYWEFHERGGRKAVRKENWKIVQYDMGKNPDAPIELYDLAQDPGEENNVADEHPEIVREMAGVMERARTESPLFNFGQTAYLAD